MQLKAGDEKLAWVARTVDQDNRRAAANKVAQEQKDVRWKVWVRVNLRGERRIDVGRSLGYKDGSAITQILKRLEMRLKDQPQSAQYIDLLKEKFEDALSSVNGLLPKARELLPTALRGDKISVHDGREREANGTLGRAG